MATPWEDHWFQFAITIILVLIGTGFQVTGPKSIGIVLLIVGFGWLWWLILPILAEKWNASLPRPLAALLGGWLVILLLEGIHFWWINSPESVQAQQSPPSISQGGTITGGSGNTITNTINNFITVVPTPTPQIKLGEIVQPSTKAEDGYQTTVRVHILSPFPIGNLFFAVHGKNIKGIRISPERTGPFVTGHTGVREGYAFTNIPNAYGNLRLTITSSEPLGPTNTAQVDSRIE